MPNRIIRESILSSESVCSLTWPAEVFYRRLMSVVDDYGRAEAGVQLLRSKCYPLQTDAVNCEHVQAWLDECQQAGLILVYQAAGKRYLEITKFGQPTRSKSKCPEPECISAPECTEKEVVQDQGDSNCSQLKSSANKCLSSSYSYSYANAGPLPASPARRKRPVSSLPADFRVSDGVRAWALQHGHADSLQTHFENFVGVATAKGYQYADWDAALKNAIRNNWARVEPAKPSAAKDWRKGL